MNRSLTDQLAKTARDYAISVCDQRNGTYQGKEFLDVVQDKLTELIVRECALQCVHNEDMDLIEKHFGVK